MALINNIIDIEYLINREGIGVNNLDEDDDLNLQTSTLSSSLLSIDDQIQLNLQQLDKLIQLIRDQIQTNTIFSYELNRVDCLNERLINLNELFELYKENKQLDSDQIQFLHTILVRKLNSLNSIFSLKHLSMNTEKRIDLVDKNRRILRINAINLDDLDDEDSSNEIQDLMCAIYQFDNTNLILNELLKPTQHQHSKLKPKRSSSADNYNSTMKRRLRQQNKIQNSNNLIIDSLPDNTFKLSEKCIAIHSFKFKSNKANHLNELIELKPQCSHLKIIIYKLIKLKSKLLNNQFKNPVKYVTINLMNNQPINSLYETFKLELKPFQVNHSNQRKREVTKKETAGSMLKRMFVKSKQSSLNTNSDLDLKNKCATICSFKNEYESCLCFDISHSQSEQLVFELDLININHFESWLNIWQTNRIKSLDNFEILTIYLNKIENTIPDELDDVFYHYIQIRLENKQQTLDEQYINLFRSNLFKLNEDINDVCRIPFDECDLSEKQLKFDLYKLDKNDTIKPVTSTTVNLNRTSLVQVNELNLGHLMKFSNLKVKFSFQSKYYPTRRIAIDIFEFNLDNQNASLLLNLIEIYLANKKFTESILIRKFLEFFSILNDPNKFTLKQSRLVRDQLVDKLFDAFLKLVNETQQSELKLLISNLKSHHFKSSNQFLINQLKSNDNELTIKCFNKLIEIILLLSINKCKYELKYEISDLVGKLTKWDLLDSFKFVNQLVDLYSPLELADLMINKFLSNSSLTLINSDLFELEFFVSNYQFRNKMVNYLIKSRIDKNRLSDQNLKLIKSIFDHKQNISKQNLDDLVKLIFKQLINSLINCLKMNEFQDRKQINKNINLQDNFFCLFEILNLIQTTKDLIDNQDLNYLFEIIIFYLKTKLMFDEQLQLRINLIILKFSKFIQKHLQFYQIAKEDDESLIQSYFEMLFSFVNTSNVSHSLTIRLKFKMIKIIHLFWTSLSSKFKRSICLNEFLITRVCKSLMSNLYFKLIEFKPASNKPIATNSRLYLNQFISCLSFNSDSCVYLFYDLCFKILTDILVYNQFELNNLNEFILFNLMNWILNKENNIECRLSLCSNSSSNYESGLSTSSNEFDFDIHFERNLSQSNKSFKNFGYQIFELFEKDTTNLDMNRKSIINSMRICIDYNQLKDDFTYNEISIIENLLLTYNLIKQVDELNVKSNNKLFTCQAYLNENRRQIKMYLLDDLYSLYKLDKNYLQMSLVRKQQAELIELNLNRKNESDLKEIFYLKSIKRFQINSLNESILPVAIATPSTSSSVSASSFSSSSSSSSSISLALQSTTASTNTSGVHSEDCFHSDSSIHFEVCKQLCAYYEKIDETYSKFNRILNAESKFMKPSMTQIDKNNLQLHGNLYFRIGIFGQPFKSRSIRNKYYLYKHNSYEMLSNIQNLLISKLTYLNLTESNIVLLHHNQEPDVAIKETKENKCYLQICAVNRLEKHKLLELLEEMNDDKETTETKEILTSNKYSENEFFYYFDRPFYMRCSNSKKNSCKNLDDNKENETIENLWLERSILVTDEYSNKFENSLTQFEEIKSVHKILLNPIRNAINDIHEKTKELKQFIIQFKNSNIATNCLTLIHNLQPLTMRLLGCLDARINGGLIKYVKELLCQNLVESKSFSKKKHLFDQLFVSIRDQLDVLKIGLNVHHDILKEVNLKKMKYSDESDSLNELKYQKNYEHMYQLHEHLIDCFKMIDTELDQRWNSIYNSCL